MQMNGTGINIRQKIKGYSVNRKSNLKKIPKLKIQTFIVFNIDLIRSTFVYWRPEYFFPQLSILTFVTFEFIKFLVKTYRKQ